MALAPNLAYRLLNPEKSKYGVGTVSTPQTIAPSNVQPSSVAQTPSIQGSAPNYTAMIQNDPLYKQALSDLSAEGVADASQAGSGIMRALVNRGLVPDLATAAQRLGLSPQVLDFIRQNVDFGKVKTLAEQATKSGVSQEAQLEHQHELEQGKIRNMLAARGLLRSGANAFLSGEEERANTQRRYAADQGLADYIAGVMQAFSQSERSRLAAQRQAAQDAASRQQQLFDATPGEQAPAGSGLDNSGPVSTEDFLKALVLAAKTGQPVAV